VFDLAPNRNEYQEMFLEGKARLLRKIQNLSVIYKPTNVGSSISHNPMGFTDFNKDSFNFCFTYMYLQIFY
jgi:hypothetical protein